MEFESFSMLSTFVMMKILWFFDEISKAKIEREQRRKSSETGNLKPKQNGEEISRTPGSFDKF